MIFPRRIGRPFLVLCASVLLVPSPALAQRPNLGQILGGALIRGIAVSAARRSWEGVDSDVKDCLQIRFNLNTDQLTQQGVQATDYRLGTPLATCRQQVAQARLSQQQEEQARAAQAEQARIREQEEAQARAAAAAAQEQQRQAEARAQAQAAADARREAAAEAKAQKEAEARAKAEATARLHDLTAKYGAKIASAIAAGQALPGMTKDEVIAARGEPISKDVIPPSDELWHYGTDQIAFTKDKATYIGH